MLCTLSLQVTAKDEDFGEYGTIVYDIFSDQMKEYFSIDKVKGEIVTKIRLDREEQKVYEIPVVATDGGGRSGFATVRVRVGDQNDNAPRFYLNDYKISIYGNLSLNATILNVILVIFFRFFCVVGYDYLFFPWIFMIDLYKAIPHIV